MKLWRTEEATRETSPVHLIVGDWADVINRHGELPPNPNTISIFDSHYMTNASVQVAEDKGVMFLGSAKANNFNNLVDLVKHFVINRGDWAGIYSETSHDMFIHKWERDDSLGEKYCLTNAFKVGRGSRSSAHCIPGYDLYKLTFAACDEFNRRLHDRKWPHRCGGGTRYGDTGHDHKFAMAVLLQNTFNVYAALHEDSHNQSNYAENCFNLSDELYECSANL